MTRSYEFTGKALDPPSLTERFRLSRCSCNPIHSQTGIGNGVLGFAKR
jgi:hypothetical protein